MKSLCGLSYVVLTFLGALNMKRVLGFLFGVLATLWMAAPAAAWTLNDSEEPGSVLVFPHFSRDADDFAATQFEISVVCPKGDTCVGFGTPTTINTPGAQVVHLKGHWVCPPAVATNICAETDFALATTVWGSVTFTPLTTTPIAPCQENGYLIVYAVDSTGAPIKFDGLMGTMVEHENVASIYALHALPIQAGEDIPSGQPTDLNGNGQLDFDGNEYKEITGTIQGPIQFDDPNIETALTLLTLDVRSGVSNFSTDLSLNFYSSDEAIASVNTSFTCVNEIELHDIPGMPNAASANWTPYGLVQSMSATQNGQPATVVGFVEVKQYSVPVATEVNVTLKWAHWLYNNSDPLPTTFCVNVLNCPNAAPADPPAPAPPVLPPAPPVPAPPVLPPVPPVPPPPKLP
jgi:hypothetical protein